MDYMDDEPSEFGSKARITPKELKLQKKIIIFIFIILFFHYLHIFQRTSSEDDWGNAVEGTSMQHIPNSWHLLHYGFDTQLMSFEVARSLGQLVHLASYDSLFDYPNISFSKSLNASSRNSFAIFLNYCICSFNSLI